MTTNGNNLAAGKQNRNLDISGNTLVNNNGVGLKMPSLNPTSGSRIANNVVIEDSGDAFSVGDQTGGLEKKKRLILNCCRSDLVEKCLLWRHCPTRS